MLYEQARALDIRNAAYCLIGHSHGGSVIGHALTVGVSKPTTRLQCLSSWMTVGTPFVQMQRRRFLFPRLPRLGRSAYLVVAIFALNPISAAIDRIARALMSGPKSSTCYFGINTPASGSHFCMVVTRRSMPYDSCVSQNSRSSKAILSSR